MASDNKKNKGGEDFCGYLAGRGGGGGGGDHHHSNRFTAYFRLLSFYITGFVQT